MHIEDFRWWHWIVIGLLLGAAFGGVKQWEGPWFDGDDLTTMDQLSFEHEISGEGARFRGEGRLIDTYHKNQPFLKDLVIHPPLPGEPSGSMWITGKTYTIILDHRVHDDRNSPVVPIGQWDPFKFRAKVPFVAFAVDKGKYANVREYLATVQKKTSPQLAYSYAWWEKPLPTLLMPTAAGLLIVGIAWPLMLGLMQGAGLARPRGSGVSLAGMRSVKAPEPVVVDHTADNQRLDALNAQMEDNLSDMRLGSAPAAAGDVAPVAGESPIKPLAPTDASDPTAPPMPQPHDASKEYGGEFYPVVRPAQSKP